MRETERPTTQRANDPTTRAARTLLLAGVALALVAPGAWANDGDLQQGGAPKLLSSHPSVAMQNEVVRMNIGRETVRVDCRFVFVNHGPACTARMGFPDEDARHEPDDSVKPGSKPQSYFTSFKSWVDGKPVATTLVQGDPSWRKWHVKEVSFPANGRREVRDVYTLPVGGQLTAQSTNVRLASYVLHTGASWHGPIGRTEVIVTFNRPGMPAKLAPRLMEAAGKTHIFEKKWPGGRETVYYRGPCKPTVEGRTLRFVRTNWRPTEADDIYLAFDNRKPSE